jgi:glutathione S-transferase
LGLGSDLGPAEPADRERNRQPPQRQLEGRDYLLGEALTGADIQLSFVGELAGLRTDRAIYPNLDAWVRRFQARPAYKAAIARGGPYSFAS